MTSRNAGLQAMRVQIRRLFQALKPVIERQLLSKQSRFQQIIPTAIVSQSSYRKGTRSLRY